MHNAIVDRATSKLLAAAIALTLLPGPASAVVSAPELPNPGHTGMGRQQQIQLGYQSAAQVYQQMPVLPDNSPETQYVRQLGAKLVATIPSSIHGRMNSTSSRRRRSTPSRCPAGPCSSTSEPSRQPTMRRNSRG